jgi:hypothetical protein
MLQEPLFNVQLPESFERLLDRRARSCKNTVRVLLRAWVASCADSICVRAVNRRKQLAGGHNDLPSLFLAFPERGAASVMARPRRAGTSREVTYGKERSFRLDT